MARVYLTKEFHESDGLELVSVHWLTAAPGAAPDWSKARSLVLQSMRHGDSWVRRGVLAVDCEGAGPWVLHHFFDWVRRGVLERGPAYSEDIVARLVVHEQPDTEYSHATLVYNLGECGWTNAMPMVLEGAPPAPSASPEWPEGHGTSGADRERREAALKLAPPLRFQAEVLGPVGARVLYSIYLAGRQGLNPMAERGRWLFRREFVI